MLAVGTSGQVLTSNGAAAPSWTTISTGPVTTYGAVGSYVIAYVSIAAQATNYSAGTTYSGSSLTYFNDYNTGISLNSYPSSPISSQIFPSVLANSGYMASLGLSGTWRSMTYNASNFGAFYNVSLALLVRVS
jgi:hypothetical protein